MRLNALNVFDCNLDTVQYMLIHSQWAPGPSRPRSPVIPGDGDGEGGGHNLNNLQQDDLN